MTARAPRTTDGSRLRRWCALALVVSSVSLQAQSGIRIVPLVRDGSVLISFSVSEAYTSDVKAVIQSGLRTTFTYTVDLRLEVPAWVDRTVASTVVNNSVQFDNLTRQHTVVRSFDGRVEDSLVTEDGDLVKQLMTTFERAPLFRTSMLEPNREYYVRVFARARPSGASFVWPWNSGPSGLAKFTFIP